METTHPLPNILKASGSFDPSLTWTEIHLNDGQILRLNTSALSVPPVDVPSSRYADVVSVNDQVLIPLIEERLTVDKRVVETGKVRLQKTIQEYSEALDEPLNIHTYDIERVVLNRPIDDLPATRTEGDTTIYPLVEEQLILTKQLILKEEVRVTRRHSVKRDTRVVRLQREHLDVEREVLL